MNLGELIKHHRKTSGMTVFQLARLTNITPSYIYLIEKGKIINVGFEKLAPIAKALKINLQTLVEDYDS